jgi:hypothetical protein
MDAKRQKGHQVLVLTMTYASGCTNSSVSVEQRVEVRHWLERSA